MQVLYSNILFLTICFFTTNSFSATIFSDNFDAEVASSTINYNFFANWDVTDGSVDIISNGGYGITCFGNTGNCVDLDGTTSNAGLLTTKQSFDLSPGVYELTFALSGSQRSGDANSVNVSLGTIFSETFTKLTSDPFELITRNIVVESAISARIQFAHVGGDNIGLILDNVVLSSVPIPAAGWLFLSGILGIYGFKKKSTLQTN